MKTSWVSLLLCAKWFKAWEASHANHQDIQDVHDVKVDSNTSAKNSPLNAWKGTQNIPKANEVEVVGKNDQCEEDGDDFSCHIHHKK